MLLKHTRHQLPVGQGFFHAGTVSIGASTFNYVYDCGSEYPEPLNRAVNNYIENLCGETVDALFVSHLDLDHVCGLDQLLLLSKVEIAILPYLSPVARLIVIAKAADRGLLNSTYLNLLCDPTEWLVSRGVQQVIYVTAGEEEGEGAEPPDFTEPPRNSPELAPPHPAKVSEMVGPLELDVGLIDDDRQRIAVRQRYRAKTKIVSCDTPLRMSARNAVCPNWQFVTFVHPEGDREEHFRQAFRKAFGGRTLRSLMRGERFEIPKKSIESLLKHPDKRERLASCYTVIRKDRNLTSMSVYSGPIRVKEDQIRRWYPWYPPPWHRKTQVGWIGTGDSNLRAGARRLRFMNHFQSIRDMVNTVSLPHHGSRHNFHSELLTVGTVFVASAGENSKYGHPDPEVEAEVGMWLQTTTEDPRTNFFEMYEIK